MLADPDSQNIRAYHVLNSEAAGQFKGMARPGYFFLDAKGVIREKFFEAKYRERLSGNNLIAKVFPELGQEVASTTETPHLRLTLEQSDPTVFPGEFVTLTAEVQLPPDVHVYAPGTRDYKPIKLVMDSAPETEFRPTIYPPSKTLYLPAIQERVPVFTGTFRIRQDVKVTSAADFSNALAADGKTLAISGKIEYQACDSKICFLPESVPVQWHVRVLPLDRQRAPEDIRHK